MRRKFLTFLLLTVIISLTSSASYAEYLEPEDSMNPTGILSDNKNHATGINNGQMIELKNSIIDFVDLNLN